MKKVTFVSLCQDKIADFTSQIKAKTAANTDDPTDPSFISKNTKQNMLYHLKRDRATMSLIMHLLEANPDVKLSDEDKNHLNLITSLSSERKSTKYVFKEGDDLYDIMVKYEKLSYKDLEAKLKKVGLHADFATGKVVKSKVVKA